MPANGETVEHCVPIWHPRLREDAEKPGEDQEMIKGVENGNFEDCLKASFCWRKEARE